MSDEPIAEQAQKPSKPRTYATTRHPNMHAVVTGKFRFQTMEQAVAKLQHLSQHFVVSKEQPEPQEGADYTPLRLWIRGFAVSKEEEDAGYRGHFAIVSVKKRKGGKGKKPSFYLHAEKDDAPLAKHPQKERPTQAYPDWGHPILRALKKDPVFDSITEANQFLDHFHETFPETSIPAQNKLYAMVYQKQLDESATPVTKYVFEIVLGGETGGFRIEMKENTQKKRKKKPVLPNFKPVDALGDANAQQGENQVSAAVVPGSAAATPDEPQGRFTSLVALKRNKKR